MAKRFEELNDVFTDFIERQHMFFVGTAAADGRVNVSPKGMDSLRILGRNRIVWLNLTGSGNETAAHLVENDRMTLMFCAFEGPPMILRLFGSAKAYHPRDPEWNEYISMFPTMTGSRQIYDLEIDLVQSSCGMAVPYFDFNEQRDQLTHWADKKGYEGISQFWEEKNQESVDGKPTRILEEEQVAT